MTAELAKWLRKRYGKIRVKYDGQCNKLKIDLTHLESIMISITIKNRFKTIRATYV